MSLRELRSISLLSETKNKVRCTCHLLESAVESMEQERGMGRKRGKRGPTQSETAT